MELLEHSNVIFSFSETNVKLLQKLYAHAPVESVCNID
jgi:hypothetical protein